MSRGQLNRMLGSVGLLAVTALVWTSVSFAVPSTGVRPCDPVSPGACGDPAELCTPAMTGKCPARDSAPTTTGTTTRRHEPRGKHSARPHHRR